MSLGVSHAVHAYLLFGVEIWEACLRQALANDKHSLSRGSMSGPVAVGSCKKCNVLLTDVRMAFMKGSLENVQNQGP